MSEKSSRAEALLFGKERMTFAEIMQSMEACAKVNCEKCVLGGPVEGWFQEDLPDCSTVLMKNATDTLLEYYNKLRTPEPAVNAKAEERHEECSSKVEGYLDTCPVCPNCNYIFDKLSISETGCVTHFPFGAEDKLDLKQRVMEVNPTKCPKCGMRITGIRWTTEDTVGGRFGYFFSRARKEELCREESSEENRKVWRWDDIFRVFRCPVCGRPEKPSMKLRTKSGVEYVLPQKCGYCGAQMEGVEAK